MGYLIICILKSMSINYEIIRQSVIPGIFVYREGLLNPVESNLGFSPRVSNRVLLHELDLCRMFTAIVEPHQYFELEELRVMAKQASRVNAEIGLPTEVNAMVIRSREVATTTSISGTNPMLIVDRVQAEDVRYTEFMDEDKKERFLSISDWRAKRILTPSIFLVHEENGDEQRRAIHARVGKLSDGSLEISLGKGVFHARQIGNDGFPYISMVGHDLRFMIEDIEMNRLWTLKTTNSVNLGAKMVHRVSEYVDKIEWALNVVSQRVGRSVVLEMRIYENAGLHIYDFDNNFSSQRAGSLSGLKPSQAYLDEIKASRD